MYSRWLTPADLEHEGVGKTLEAAGPFVYCGLLL
jgi:hypothetical protein